MAVIVDRRNGRPAAWWPIYLLLFPIPVVCFLAALAADVAYWASASLMWLHFSEWLIAGGLAFGLLAALVLLVEFFSSPGIRARPAGWSHLFLFYASLVAELLNAFMHTIDGWSAVVPIGMGLSIVGVLLALAAVATLFAAASPEAEWREVAP
jgi:uncharacterized membrane protein